MNDFERVYTALTQHPTWPGLLHTGKAMREAIHLLCVVWRAEQKHGHSNVDSCWDMCDAYSDKVECIAHCTNTPMVEQLRPSITKPNYPTLYDDGMEGRNRWP